MFKGNSKSEPEPEPEPAPAPAQPPTPILRKWIVCDSVHDEPDVHKSNRHGNTVITSVFDSAAQADQEVDRIAAEYKRNGLVREDSTSKHNGRLEAKLYIKIEKEYRVVGKVRVEGPFEVNKEFDVSVFERQREARKGLEFDLGLAPGK